MSLKPIDLTGGKSVYCFNQHQMDHAHDLFNAEGPEGQILRDEVARLENDFTRNQQATIAFMLIEHLNQTSEF
jgi:hypothetical protein